MRRIIQGVDLSDEAFALDLIKELGPGGVYLGQQHTVDHMREALSLSNLSDRDSFEDWYEKGVIGLKYGSTERSFRRAGARHFNGVFDKCQAP